ncbi:hypothetical protein Ahy_A03g014735 [Arachis hypogaea]|uniref:Uncharacterized protein n=2 Tax=Arachis hypogaea TaxID=3818 RepID=A0A445DYL1_ARAHY|nr:hypothetical protein Ahy_A03g014735 [Arachis hypogaea]
MKLLNMLVEIVKLNILADLLRLFSNAYKANNCLLCFNKGNLKQEDHSNITMHPSILSICPQTTGRSKSSSSSPTASLLSSASLVRDFTTGKALVKLIKRWPSVISKCVITLTNKLQDSNAEEYAVLGSCSVLASQTVLKQLTTDLKSFSSFIMAILSRYFHFHFPDFQQLFVKYNIQFSGVSKSFFRISDKDNHTCGLGFSDLVSQVGSMSFDSTGLHWRYNLMANRVLLLLALASRNHPNSSTRLLSETAGHFLKNLKSQLPQTRILAISALNTLLKKSPYKLSPGEKSAVLEDLQGNAKSSLEEALTHTFQEEGFFNETLNSLSHVHIISDSESASRGGHRGHK